MRNRLVMILVGMLTALTVLGTVAASPQFVGACGQSGIPTPRPC